MGSDIKVKYTKAKCISTYSELYGIQINKEQIIAKIGRLNINKTLEILKILFSTLTTPWYINFIYVRIKHLDEEKLEDILYSKQTLFYTLKWIMAYSEQINAAPMKLNISLEDIVEIIDLQLMISDYLDKDSIDPTTYIYKNIYFNTQRNSKNEIVRAYEMYVRLASQNSLYNPKEYVDINKKFTAKYNISIKEYIFVIFLLLSVHLTNFKFKNLNLDELFNGTKNQQRYITVIKSLGQDIKSYKDWAKQSIDNSWDYSQIYEYPLIKIKDKEYISLESFTIVNLLFEGLYWKIVDTADSQSDRKKIMDFLGKPFEEYVGMITEEVIKISGLEYTFIPEFKYYVKGEEKKSSDAYIIKNRTLFIIECKSSRPLRDTFQREDKDNIEKAVRKFCVKPIQQVKKAFDDICKEKKDMGFDKFEDIYIICVSLESVKHTRETIDIMKTELSNDFDDRIKGYFNLNIEEYEGLCELLYNALDIKEILDKYMKNLDDGTFINYIHKENEKIINNSWMKLKFEDIVSEIRKTIFK